ncbi:bifunctional precorrin-2 dehydrogenase/sirohydrochlorin ferrochelatase [Paenibacillus sp. FJAT-26967]|uniref:precorrin-2 dehydrogenase/sirohydrochlorin ferrochelatase family protein n=1 Tax=Paenibacillus sp. FJAT-26967 TaxID=1729690 RepID=UPI0008392B78|nr:bifunctional precorrin-2 dehydrogenase/sirohydrochlorin ferrochelatase [Paenibacillus sp. FJAT-26967]
MNREYAAMLKLTGRPCLVVGGGAVAERKIAALLEAGADVTVISPSVTPAIRSWAETGGLSWLSFHYGTPEIIRNHELEGSEKDPVNKGGTVFPDLSPYVILFAATDSREVNDLLRREADKLGKLVNIADQPDTGNMTVPAVVHRGKLTLTVSTSGSSPALAAEIRRELESAYGPEYAPYVDFLSELRETMRERIPDTQKRQELLRRVPSWNVPERIRAGDFEIWRKEVLHTLKEASSPEEFTAAYVSIGPFF